MTVIFMENKETRLQEVKEHHMEEINKLKLFQRLTNYLAVSEIYLQDNVLLKEPLKPEHIKPRLLGHWGTCPGINLIYAHLNNLILKYSPDMFLITGPGHGAPANLANLYLEQSLQEYYPDLTLNSEGLKKLIKRFSWPMGFPSHLFPGLPGTIHEGGELGYALATAFGAIMDNPNLIVACIVGDGEAETGPTATAWHSYKFIDPKESGAVLPIVHINGYKISNPTIYGTMSDTELQELFAGLGYRACIVQLPEVDIGLMAAMDWAYHEIKLIQDAARRNEPIHQPKWPVILLRTPKGMGGVKEQNGLPIEGSYRSHQVPLKDCKTNPESLRLLEEWLRSYNPQELFDQNGTPIPAILSMCPKGKLRMGMNPHTLGGKITKDLTIQNIYDFQVKLENVQGTGILRGKQKVSNVGTVANYVSEVIKTNHGNFRIFCPDELESNQLHVFNVTHRNYQWPLKPTDTDIGPDDGAVLEILSEHTCQGWMQGYTLTGRHALFPCYEAFFGIVSTMMDQYAKFIKMSKEFPWRLPVPSLNYLATSTLWRQEHNGFSHQNPGFVNTLLNKKGETARIYLPPDANCLISTMDHCFRSKDKVNLIVASKLQMPQWLTMEEAVAHCRAGASIWKWASIDDGMNPDVTLCGIGDDVTVEVMAAASILRKELPQLRLRIVNVTDLLVLEDESKHPHGMHQETFNALFTSNRSVIFNFHGYPSALKQLLFNRGEARRFQINGYQEEGTTTTPFDMSVRNGCSRFQLIIQAIRLAACHNQYVAVRASDLMSYYEYRLRDFHEFIEKNGYDPDDITGWEWN